MIAEVDDPDVYHQDFTTASSWEEFVDRIEKIIVKWKLNEPKVRNPIKKGDLEGEWETKTEHISYEGERILLQWWNLKNGVTSSAEDTDSSLTPQALVDMMSVAVDFVTVSSCPRVAQLYGVREFLLLKTNKSSKFSSETKPLSCLTIALNASGCEVPAFVQLLEDWQHFYLGSCIGKDVIADYEMVHLERTPQHCKYLTGLLDTFKSKISRGQQLPSIELAVRLTYSLKMLNPLQSYNVVTSNKSGMLNLPFGLASDPINKLHLLATWPQLTDQMVVDSQSYSDLEPMQAHIWSLEIELAENLNPPKLSLCLSSLCKMAMEPHTPFTVEFSKKFVQSLDALTESRVPTISKVFGRVLTGNTTSGAGNKKKQGAIPSSRLQEYLYFLFPDADPNSAEPYESYDAQDSSKSTQSSQHPKSLDGIKSTPPESLVWRLALLLPLIYAKDGVAAAASMWFEFTEEMCYRWEQAIPVPGVRPGFADHKTCILHQKLQMLNVCIEKKKARSQSGGHQRAGSSDSDGDGEDEFFDCDTTATEEQDMVDASDNSEPEGRKHAHPSLKLLRTGGPLYIPVTQDLVPKTEDEVESEPPLDAPVGGSEGKVHLYSCSVTRSDMQSFKAANPDGILEDFVRWYSPGDWVEDQDPDKLDEWGQRRGELSARMRLKDNMWVQLWSMAQPVPAHKQVDRLFDETRSAEGVLAWLEGLSARALALALLPALAHACALRTLAEVHADSLLGKLPGLQPAADALVRHAVAASREPEPSLQTYQRLVAELEDAERLICTARSLRCKLCPGPDASDEMVAFLTALLELREVTVPGGARGRIGGNIRTMFSEAQMTAQMLSDASTGAPGRSESGKTFSFPAADTKEVVMRVCAPRPSAASRTCPQRMYALHRRDEFRLAGCFSRDATFF